MWGFGIDAGGGGTPDKYLSYTLFNVTYVCITQGRLTVSCELVLDDLGQENHKDGLIVRKWTQYISGIVSCGESSSVL